VEHSLSDDAVRERMRADWNQRAREDSHYYAAFARLDQEEGEFFSTAADVVRDLESELKRLSPEIPVPARRALEIGCGPGRLMRPMSRHFGEIHGVDISDEMIAQARRKLHDIPHAHLDRTTGSDLSLFPSDHFDFVYSYAVFQHIPSAEIVFSYLRETVRVLKPGGFARLQIDGRPRPALGPTACEDPTWEGVRIGADEIRAFTRRHGIGLLSLTGVDTQYMWTSWRKPFPCRIRQVVNAFSQEPFVPATGRLACAALEIENLPRECDLNSLEAFIDGVPGANSYISPVVKGISQFNVFLPEGVRMGLVPVRVEWHGERLCPDSIVRIIPPGPVVPRLISVCDGVNLVSQRIESGWVTVTLEDVESIDDFAATLDGALFAKVEIYKTDPLASRYEINLHLPAAVSPGGHVLEIHVRKRVLARMGIEVV
jgi:SAM-dependent methyltransferase